MIGRKPTRSSARKPFEAFQEVQLNLTISSDPLEGSVWTFGTGKKSKVNWALFLADAGFEEHALAQVFITHLQASTLPTASVLAAAAIRVFDFRQRLALAATPGEVGDQLAAMRRAAATLASLAYGNDGRTPPGKEAPWIVKSGAEGGGLLEELANSHRSPFLHPMIQDHIGDSFLNIARQAQVTPGNEAALLGFAQAQGELLRFFEQLPKMIQCLENAEQHAREVSLVSRRSRKKGAPGNDAVDWLLIRLMWIWRDVLGQEVKIYLRRMRERQTLAVPEPTGCMEFVVFVLRNIEVVRPHQLGALERRLTALTPKVPDAPLVSKQPS